MPLALNWEPLKVSWPLAMETTPVLRFPAPLNVSWPPLAMETALVFRFPVPLIVSPPPLTVVEPV